MTPQKKNNTSTSDQETAELKYYFLETLFAEQTAAHCSAKKLSQGKILSTEERDYIYKRVRIWLSTTNIRDIPANCPEDLIDVGLIIEDILKIPPHLEIKLNNIVTTNLEMKLEINKQWLTSAEKATKKEELEKKSLTPLFAEIVTTFSNQVLAHFKNEFPDSFNKHKDEVIQFTHAWLKKAEFKPTNDSPFLNIILIRLQTVLLHELKIPANLEKLLKEEIKNRELKVVKQEIKTLAQEQMAARL